MNRMLGRAGEVSEPETSDRFFGAGCTLYQQEHCNNGCQEFHCTSSLSIYWRLLDKAVEQIRRHALHARFARAASMRNDNLFAIFNAGP